MPVAYARQVRRPRTWDRIVLGLAGTLLLPGVGHLALGSVRRGITWIGLAVVAQVMAIIGLIFPGMVLLLIPTVPACIIVFVACIVDVVLTALRTTGGWPRSTLVRVFAALGCAALVVLTQPGVIVASAISSRFVRAYATASASMAPALQPGDRVLVHHRAPLTRWSIVVYDHPQVAQPLIARLVGLPGETVEIVGHDLRINGAVITPPSCVGPYASVNSNGVSDPSGQRAGNGCEGNPIHLGADEYFVLGDNSARALDSRYWWQSAGGHPLGALPRNNIRGRVTSVHWPPTRWRKFD